MLRRHPVPGVALLCLVLVLPGVVAGTADWARRSALDQIEDRARRTLALTRAGLTSELRRHEALPLLLAVDAAVPRFLRSQRLPRDIDRMNRRLAQVNRIAHAGDTYLMDATGLTLASSNWNHERPFVGRNFSYRPYFQDALGGTLGRYFALGTTSKRRGYYFAAPVRDGQTVVGVLAVKVDVAPIERTWTASNETILVTDPDGVVFMSNHDEWVFRSVTPLGETTLARIRASRRYDETVIEALDIGEPEARQSGASLFTMREPGSATRFLGVSLPVAEHEWTVHVLADIAPVAGQVNRAVATAVFGFAVALLLVLLVLQRRLRIKERLERDAAAKLELEQRVRERTADLTTANERLTGEIAERRHAEEELRRTQRELIQASKLSALGEMSAGVSHELNQPLAAIRSFAENAEEFIARGRDGDARSNLERIAALTGRMARIIAALRTFARKDEEAPGSVNLGAVLDDALSVVAPRIQEADVTVERTGVSRRACARGEPTRLSQVVVNILANALDAMSGTPQPRLRITLSDAGDRVSLTIEDSGPGIPPDCIGSIFDPFFTTKDVDRGLGLGLSISYGIVAGFGGEIRADNGPLGGARFTLTLPKAETTAETGAEARADSPEPPLRIARGR